MLPQGRSCHSIASKYEWGGGIFLIHHLPALHSLLLTVVLPALFCHCLLLPWPFALGALARTVLYYALQSVTVLGYLYTLPFLALKLGRLHFATLPHTGLVGGQATVAVHHKY